ncbi:hypothetical protein FSP39_007671 [Pinctada imbricata]|uniref:Uncharacterized protein n=1 Tax=Pinctada imbricata TaxID=66713 RepID=A0AA88XX07_PINIB|nr:hypothetical protein FSP39_007671 [Pinctada imbricata]
MIGKTLLGLFVCVLYCLCVGNTAQIGVKVCEANMTVDEGKNKMAIEAEVHCADHDHDHATDLLKDLGVSQEMQEKQLVSKKRYLSSDEITDLNDRKRTKAGDQSQSGSDSEINVTTVFNMFQSLSVQLTGLSGLYNDLRDRMSSIEANLEAKLSQKFKSVLDTRFELEMSEIRAETTAEIAVVRNEVNTRCDELTKTYAAAVEYNLIPRDTKKSVVIKMLPERANEKTKNDVTVNCVNALLKDGLHLLERDARVVTATRKEGKPGSSNPGVVIVDFENVQQKENVLKEKQKLRLTNRYRKVYIEEAMTQDEVKADRNLRTIIREMGAEKDYYVKNGRMIKRTTRRESDNDAHGERNRDTRTQSQRDADYNRENVYYSAKNGDSRNRQGNSEFRGRPGGQRRGRGQQHQGRGGRRGRF